RAGVARGSRAVAPGHAATDVGLQSFPPNRIASFPLHPLTHSTSKTRAAQSLRFFLETALARIGCSPRRYLLNKRDRDRALARNSSPDPPRAPLTRR
ncbi:MAG: hypothetical protein ABIS28_13610, partial [Caldimonas sp.]